jgi:hypothetical protein
MDIIYPHWPWAGRKGEDLLAGMADTSVFLFQEDEILGIVKRKHLLYIPTSSLFRPRGTISHDCQFECIVRYFIKGK